MSAAKYLKRLERDRPGAGQAAAQAASNENFCLVGTPLPSLESKKDRNDYEPVWQQEVLDEQGRRRFHGAFTGGYSAGYFNTVGSKEGWTPSTWKSSKDTNQNKRSRPEDFMDEEDLEALKEARVLQTRPDYDLLAGDDANKRSRVDDGASDTFANIFRPAKHGIGTLLMRKMGWRDGQGVGPRVSVLQAKSQDANLNVLVEHGENHTFAPKDTALTIPPRQIASQGLGYAYTVHSLRPSQPDNRVGELRGDISHGFGLGIEDADEDDMDVYGGPSAGIEKKNKLNQLAYDDNQHQHSSFAAKQQRRQTSPRDSVGVGFFNDGKPLLKGFALQKGQQQEETWFSQPDVPKDWKPDPSRVLKLDMTDKDAQKVKPAARDAHDRARILGEELPKKSVFDYISAKDKQRLEKEQSDYEDEEIRIPPIDKATANNALRASIPFPEDDAKRGRYTAYLHSQSDPQNYPADIVNLSSDGQTKTQFNIELVEFQKVASLYKPMTAAMAGRFTTGSRSVGASETPVIEPGLRPGVAPKPKEPSPPPKSIEEVRAERDAERMQKETPLQKAVREGTMGIKHGTHTFAPWKPSKLLCRRFQVPPPAITLESDDKESDAGFQFGKRTGEEVPKKQDAWAAAGLQDTLMPAPPNLEELESRHAAVAEQGLQSKQVGLGEDEKTMEEIAKQTRPSMDVFKAIFDDSEDEKPKGNDIRENRAEPQKTAQKKKKKEAKKRSNALNKLTFDDDECENVAEKAKAKRQTAADFM